VPWWCGVADRDVCGGIRIIGAPNHNRNAPGAASTTDPPSFCTFGASGHGIAPFSVEIPVMGRRLRSQLPGVPFHVTARVQGHGPLFSGLERVIGARIVAAPRRSDATLLAFAVMPNHLHALLL